MRIKGILFTIVVLLGLLFAVSNWQTITTTLPLNLLFFSVQLPLGLTLLVAAVGLSAIFFAVSLLDRATQLRQITQLERQLDGLRGKLERRRLEEFEALEGIVNQRFDALGEKLDGSMTHFEEVLRDSLAEFELRDKERLAALETRVVLIRDELAADIAEAEDSLKRQARGEEDVEPA